MNKCSLMRPNVDYRKLSLAIINFFGILEKRCFTILQHCAIINISKGGAQKPRGQKNENRYFPIKIKESGKKIFRLVR